MSSRRKNIFVAMSGGVDSSVSAALLKKQDYNVVGVFMRPWSRFASNDSLTSKSRIRDSQNESGQPYWLNPSCQWQQDREHALRAATVIGIPLLTWDLSNEYERKVTKYMIEGYKSGITPNPDVMCNKHIKFGAFLKKALKEGADLIATGHYARIVERQTPFGTRNSPARNFSKLSQRSLSVPLKTMPAPSQITSQSLPFYTYELLKGKDKNKDQSYFLYTLGQKELSRTLFPIGEFTKPEVRKLAKKFGLPNWDKKDSQGVCFVGELEMSEFLKNYIKPKPGDIIRASDKKILGQHEGVYYYTIGQRHGLNIQGNGEIYFVSDKNTKKNIVYVDTLAKESRLFKSSAILKDMTWINSQPTFPLKAVVKTRYRQPDQEAKIMKPESWNVKQKNTCIIKFKKPQKAITSGQSAVIYQKDKVLGGGILK